MSSRDTDKKSPSKEQVDDKGKRQGKSHATQTTTSSESSNKSSKLLEGVVFVLSGFVNPERSTLRSQALEMGAKYEADWNNNCTLLVCAFPNTPKFRQVEADNGTIISKDWITECYSQKQLIGIEPYLLHAGKPWRHQSLTDSNPSSSKNKNKQVDKSTDSKPQASTLNKTEKHAKNEFLTSEVKKWAVDDMERTISWLDSQDEKPDPSEMKKIAAEGILTCLQDALDSLKQGQGLGKIMEEWSFVPRVIEELNKMDSVSTSRKDIYHQAIACKKIYEFEVGNLKDDTTDRKQKRPKIEEGVKTENQTTDDVAYDSDDTIEMTEDEIREAFDNIVDDDHFAHRS